LIAAQLAGLKIKQENQLLMPHTQFAHILQEKLAAGIAKKFRLSAKNIKKIIMF